MKICAFLLCYVVVSLICTVWATNYCNPKLCQGMGNHIGCNANRNFGPACPPDAYLVDINRNLQDVLVSDINKYRNYIAGGGDRNHSPACRMATMQWDNELADLAALNVITCTLSHDQCHNTDAFQYAGQNLAWSSSNGRQDTEASLRTGIKMWFEEVSNSNMRIIKRFPNSLGNFGHFTVMMADKNIRVGCAASTYSSRGSSNKNFLIACNFATTNMVDHPIYKDCPSAATGCTTGTNQQYPNLCSPSEAYDVNKWF